MFCFTFLSLSLHLLFYLPLSSLLTHPHPPPRPPPLLWSSLPSCLTGGEVYSLTTEFTLAIGKWVVSGMTHLLLCFVVFCQRVICVALPLYFLLFLLFDCCVVNSTLDDRYAPRALSHTLSSYLLLPRTPSVTVLLGAVCCCMSSQLIDAKNLFDCWIFSMFFVMSLVCFKPDTPEAQHET